MHSIVVQVLSDAAPTSTATSSRPLFPTDIFSLLEPSYRSGVSSSLTKLRRLLATLHLQQHPHSTRSTKVKPLYADLRLGHLAIDWIDFATELDSSLQPQTMNSTETTATFVPYTSGRTVLNAGVLHLFRDASTASGVSENNADDSPSSTVCILAVPAYMTAPDLLQFIAPYTAAISHIRFLRDSIQSRAMVLIRFREGKAFEGESEAFSREYSGRLFNSLDDEVCRVVYIKSVQFQSEAIPQFAFPPAPNDPNSIFSISSSSSSFPPSKNPSKSSSPTIREAATPAGEFPTTSTDLIELPTCPVVLTVWMPHLSKWQDASCPVCRYSSNPPPTQPSSDPTSQSPTPPDTIATTATTNPSPHCETCNTSQNLWICLICGNVGCGRYQSAHAAAHYTETSHLYSLELETQRVWDYAGDGYVHRLIRTGKMKGKGKKVFDDWGDEQDDDDIGLEYSVLLSSQLESQRCWYEEKMNKMNGLVVEASEKVEEIVQELRRVEEAKRRAEAERDEAILAALEEKKSFAKEKERTDRKWEKLLERLTLLEKTVGEERQMNEMLRQNQDSFKKALEEKECELSEKKKQARN
ncbi:zf-UBP-domain-containing protein [Rhizoclosmatium globosum]|uniref:Zf-UBP-domain-containing protein n=1 Tax=Rhizoclosmatium globosum TaxID=329046 RepID=A0A1Y2CCL0_9FUNG|nr:zf-UBP-domain-containing protein [Rhizoclosmatium globosum]|eukprot:ORY44772.1 zf-UBP-domain-containing protein [Rhizoclosmatium globosum]